MRARRRPSGLRGVSVVGVLLMFLAPESQARRRGHSPSTRPIDLSRRLVVLTEVERLDRRLVTAEAALRTAQRQRERIEQAQAATQSAQATASLHHADATRAFGRRLGALLRQPPSLRWVVVSGSRSLADNLEADRLLEAVARHDRALWAAVRASEQQLLAVSAEQEEQARALADNEALLRRSRDAIGERRRQKSDLLARLEDAASLRRDLAYEQQAAAARLGQLAQRPRSRARAASRVRLARQLGRLTWPARGRIQRGFGERVEMTFGTTTSHNGLDIGAPAGSEVLAVADGQVVFADWLHGYGQVVIVDHHDGYHAVMAHLARTDVRRGAPIQAGQAIGTVGDTGSLRGTVLYFEIRHRGRPVDPRPLLGRSNLL